jgi:NitT/TauT family transport system substrate-binding protein
MKTSHKRLLSVILILMFVAVSCLAGCTGAKEPQKVRLTEVIHSVFYAPMYVALTKGFFKEEGLEIDFSTAWGGDKAAAALLSNNADIALIGPETTIYVYTQGASNRLINFAQLSAMDGSFLVARKPMPNFNWQDTKGHNVIGGRKGGAPQMVLESVMKKNGVHPFNDTNMIQTVQYDTTTAAFKAGVGDFVQIYEPGASMLEKEGSGYVVASLGKDGGKMPFTNFIASEKYIKEHPQTIQKFTNAVHKAQIWIYSHSVEEITDNVAPFFPGVDRDILVRTLTRYKEQETWAKSPVISTVELDRLQDTMVLSGELKQKVPFEKVVDVTFAQKALEAVK